MRTLGGKPPKIVRFKVRWENGCHLTFCTSLIPFRNAFIHSSTVKTGKSDLLDFDGPVINIWQDPFLSMTSLALFKIACSRKVNLFLSKELKFLSGLGILNKLLCSDSALGEGDSLFIVVLELNTFLKLVSKGFRL